MSGRHPFQSRAARARFDARCDDARCEVRRLYRVGGRRGAACESQQRVVCRSGRASCTAGVFEDLRVLYSSSLTKIAHTLRYAVCRTRSPVPSFFYFSLFVTFLTKKDFHPFLCKKFKSETLSSSATHLRERRARLGRLLLSRRRLPESSEPAPRAARLLPLLRLKR